MRIFSYVFLLLTMLLGITFSALNANHVLFNYYFGSKQIPLALLLVITFGVGIFTSLLVAVFSMLKLKKENYHLRSRLKIVEKELENLRYLPLKEE